MNRRKSSLLSLIIYELKNIAGNPFTLFFGIIFPIFMSFFITNAILPDMPTAEIYKQMSTKVFITMSTVIPMAVIFLGYAANYSQELEKEIPLRMNLFGFTQKTLLTAKIIAQLLAVTAALAIYVTASLFLLELLAPAAGSALILLLCLYLLSIILFILAHGIASLFKKFGPTYFVSMLLYFGIMLLCGMMGISTDNFPPALQYVSNTVPITYICNDFIEVWQGNRYNYMPLVQSFLFLGAVSLLLLLYALYRNRRKTG